MYGTLQQESAKASLKAALLAVLVSHTPEVIEHPHDCPESITVSLQITEHGIDAMYELSAIDRGVDVPCGGGSL